MSQFWHRIKLPDGTYTPGICNHGPDGGDWPTTRFGLPEDLTGKSVLDIGCWDGFFSFECEKRGAKFVTASDYNNDPGRENFLNIKKILNSKIEYTYLNIEDKYPYQIMIGPGTFDLVMCFGVLYHLKSPLVAMENLFKILSSDGVLLLETAISNKNEVPLLEYKPGFENDPTNYFYPNHLWINKSALQIGFSSIKLLYEKHNRATYILTKD